MNARTVPADGPAGRLLGKLESVRPAGAGWQARCPAHDDAKPSLSVDIGDGGKVLVKCRAGCDTHAVLAAVGLTFADLVPDSAAAAPRPVKKSKERAYPTRAAAVSASTPPGGTLVKAWPYTDAEGKEVGAVVRWDTPAGKTFRPIRKDADGWRCGAMPEPRPLYNRPALAAAAAVVVTEGEKAADAAAALGFTATTSPGGSQAAGKADWTPLAGKEVWILPDHDEAGEKYADAVAKRLAALTPPATVKMVRLPGLPPKGDIADRDASDPAALRAEVEMLAAAAEPDAPADARPDFVVTTEEHAVNAAAADALAADEDLFQRGGVLVHVVNRGRDASPDAVRREPGTPVVRPLPRTLLREKLTRCAHWVRQRPDREGGTETVPAHPPEWCVGAVLDRGDWPGVRELAGIVTYPVVRADGTMLAESGYDPATRLLACIPPELSATVPESPTPAEVAAAVETLCEPLADFQFPTPAHRAAFVAGLLTPLAWEMFDGPAPLFLIDGNTRGVGKGLLADVAALTVTGRRFPVTSYTHDREELRKRITTLAVEGDRLVLLDNMAGDIGNDILDAALTSDTWKDRLLGGNRVYNGPLHVVWFGTGNNVQLRADTARRVCHVRLETPDERPEVRGGFRFPNLRGHVLQTRGRLLGAALTLLRGWHVAGRPTHGLKAWGSYEAWSGVVREAVVFAGLPDPGETRLELQTSADRDAAAMRDLLAGMAEADATGRGLTAAELVTLFKSHDNGTGTDSYADARAAVEELCGKLCGKSLGYKLRHFARRNFGGRMIDKAGTGGSGSTRWRVLPAGVGPAPDG